MTARLEERILRELGVSEPAGLTQAELVQRIVAGGGVRRDELSRALDRLAREDRVIDDGERLHIGLLPLDAYWLAQQVAQMQLVAECDPSPQSRAAAAVAMQPTVLVALVALQHELLRRLDRVVELLEESDGRQRHAAEYAAWREAQ